MALIVTITGNLLAPPEIKYANNQAGTPYTRIRVALNKKQGDDNLFAVADVTIFKFAEAANDRLQQGSRILIAGSAFPKWYETKENEVVAALDVVADHWECLDPKTDPNGRSREAGPPRIGGVCSGTGRSFGTTQRRNGFGVQRRREAA